MAHPTGAAKKRVLSSASIQSSAWQGWLEPASLPKPSAAATVFESFDWNSTELGPLSSWPAEVHMLLTNTVFPCALPVTLLLGPRLRLAHNDAYRKIIAQRREIAMGVPVFETFPEAKNSLQAIFLKVLSGEPHYHVAMPIFVSHEDYQEETYWDLNYFPIRLNTGQVVGIYGIVPEVTARIVTQRRLDILEAIVCKAHPSTDTIGSLVNVVSILTGFPIEFPFAVLYILNRPLHRAERIQAIGTSQDQLRAVVILSDPDDDPYKIGLAASSGKIQRTERLHSGRATAETPIVAYALPIRAPSISKDSNKDVPQEVLAVLVVGHSPLAALNDESYVGLLRLTAARLSSIASISVALALERQQREEHQRLSEAKSAFFSNLSHEFRTTINLMIAPLEELVQRQECVRSSEADCQYRIRLAFQNGERLLRLVNNLLDFSRGESGMDASVSLTAVSNFTAFTIGLVQNFSFALESAKLRLRLDQCEDIAATVYVDLTLWEKIIYNLVSNAIKYSVPGGEVSVSLRCSSSSCVELNVSDMGIGIASEHLPHLFERYYRVPNATARPVEGTGIGLALIHDLVRLLNGCIKVRSEPNVGTSFILTLPLLVSPSISTNVPVEAPRVATTLPVAQLPFLVPELPTARDVTHITLDRDSILLTEDNDQMRGYIRLLLEKAGYKVIEASNGRDALIFLQQTPILPNLVLSDVMMPVMDGLELVAHIRRDARLSSLPVILLSARGGEESKLSGLATSCDDYLVKPFTARELLARVRTSVELVRQRATIVREREASEMKDRFFAVVSHELRTPLTPVMLLAEGIATNVSSTETVRQDALLICRSIQLEVAMIDDLLDCAKLLRDRIDIKPSIVDAKDIITQTVAMIRPLLDEHHHEVLITHHDMGTSYVRVDAVRLHQVLWNLLKNAARFTPALGRVSIETRNLCTTSSTDVEFVEFSVVDSGPGIESSLLPRQLFELGIQGTKHRNGGLGIGLFLSKSLVERQGGTMTAENDSNGGARFTFTIPAAVASTSERNDKLCVPAPMAGKYDRKLRVLLVEDNNASRIVMARLLEKELHCDVHTAASVSEAQQLAVSSSSDDAETKYDLLISDIGLPDGDGWQLMRTLRQSFPHLRGIALSGYGAVEDMKRSEEVGFSAHLTKPVRLITLRSAIQTTLEGSM